MDVRWRSTVASDRPAYGSDLFEFGSDPFTSRYQALLKHYRLEGHKTQPASPHENGDVEQRHPLPAGRLESCKQLTLKVGPCSTIHVAHNTYSVDSRLISETIQVRMLTETQELWYGRQRLETLPRQRGDGGHHIQYRHLIPWLVRNSGAFGNYRYWHALYPTTRFRLAYDLLKRSYSTQGVSRRYLQILELAATESETAVDQALKQLLEQPQQLTPDAVKAFMRQETAQSVREITIDPVPLDHYDALLTGSEVRL